MDNFLVDITSKGDRDLLIALNLVCGDWPIHGFSDNKKGRLWLYRSPQASDNYSSFPSPAVAENIHLQIMAWIEWQFERRLSTLMDSEPTSMDGSCSRGWRVRNKSPLSAMCSVEPIWAHHHK